MNDFQGHIYLDNTVDYLQHNEASNLQKEQTHQISPTFHTKIK